MLKAGIIGYGYMGEIRRKNIEEHPGMELKIVCETNESKLCGTQYFEVVRSPDKVLESDIDIIFVCTPNNLIPELVVKSLRRNKHVFCEKPPGTCLQDVEKMRAEEMKHPNLKLMFGFNHRYHPGILRAQKIVESGKMGKILYLRGIYGKSGGKNFHQSWRNQKNVSGGGILLDQGIHMLDLFRLFCGDFNKVKAFTTNTFWKFDLEDNAQVILTNEKNQLASLHSSATLWKHTFQIELGLEEGYLIVKGLLSKTGSYGRETLIIGKKQFEDETEAVGNPSEEVIYFDRDLSWITEVNQFVEYIQTQTPVVKSSSLDALRVMQIIDEAYKNSQEGCE